MNIEHYILPVDCSNHVEGCGFIISDLFITLGHIIKNAENPSIRVFGEKKNLSNPVFFDCDENDSKKYNLAVFPIPGAINELELYDGKIENGIGLKALVLGIWKEKQLNVKKLLLTTSSMRATSLEH